MGARMRSDPRHLLALSFVLLLRFVAASLPAEKLRGIAPEDLKHYQSDPIWCKDKSKSFPVSRLNDDYCDCSDGTDEPGTSACPEAKFHCKNTGHAPQLLFSSRVNDGICDCCDGSDEFNGKTTCTDTCWESGKKSREKLEKKVSVYREGARLRAKEIQISKQERKQQEAELGALKKEEKSLSDVTQKLKVQLDAVEEAERREREKKTKEDEERRLKEEALRNESLASTEIAPEFPDPEEQENPEEPQGLPEIKDLPEAAGDLPEIKGDLPEIRGDLPEIKGDLPEIRGDLPEIKGDLPEFKDLPEAAGDLVEEAGSSDVDEKSELEEVHSYESPEESEELEKTGDLSKEELGRLVASRWTGEKADSPVGSEAGDSYTSETSDDDREYEHEHRHDAPEEDEDDNDDSYEYETPSSSEVTEKVEEKKSWWTRLLGTPRFLYNMLGLRRMNVDTSEADRIRSDYRQSNSKLNDLRSKISDLENKLKQDFGKEGEFFSLYEQCFERRQQKYVYKVCFYKDATQEEGHSSTRLGKWDGFQDDYKNIKFQNGDHCWNGPERSLKLKLRCGLKSEISDVEEPSRCEYSASFWTPAVCYEERAKELEAQLAAIRAGQAVPDHSEL